MENRLFAKDGDTIVIVALIPPTCFDPGRSVKALGNAYRVVAAYGLNPVFELVPLGKPVEISDADYLRMTNGTQRGTTGNPQP